MITINNNLASYILQSHLDSAANALNKSIEQMTTGFKVNHAKDNAANFGIITNMTTRIGSLEIAEDNASMALDMLSTASANLDLISSHISRLRDLANISVNGTYGQDSRDALQAELNSRLSEVSRILENGDYNNVPLFAEKNTNTPSGISALSDDDLYSEIEVTADRDTTLDELEITSRDVNIYNKDGTLINNFTLDGSDSISKFLSILNGSGFNASISNGIISLDSSVGNYITGGLADELGITTQVSTVVTSSTSTSSQAISYTKTMPADKTTTFAEAGLDFAGKSVEIYTKDTNQKAGTVTIDSNTKTFNDLFNLLSGYGITASMVNGKITLTSNGNYISGEIANQLGIGTFSSTTTETTGISQTSGNAIQYTTEVTATESTELRELGISDTSFIVENTNGLSLKTIAVSSTDTVQDFFNVLAANSISASLTNGIITLSGTNIISGELAETLGITKVLEQEGESTTVGIEYVSDSLLKTKTVNVTEVSNIAMPSSGELLTSFTYIDASDCQDIAAEDVTKLYSNETYQITTTEGLVKLAELVNNREMEENVTIVLMNDIDLSSIDNWTPINDFDYATFEGNGFSITNMKIKITNSSDYLLGLFGTVAGASIKNLKLLNAEIIVENYEKSMVGLLAGAVNMSDIFNCSVTGNIIYHYDSGDVGGLSGYVSHSNVVYCNSDVNIQSQWPSDLNPYFYTCGGLIGDLIYGYDVVVGTYEISNCYTRGVISSDYSGGLIGSVSIYQAQSDQNFIIANNNSNVINATNGLINDLRFNHSADITFSDIYNNTCRVSNTEPIGGEYVNGNVVSPDILPFGKFASLESVGYYEPANSGYITVVNNGKIEKIEIDGTGELNDIINDLQNHGIVAQYDDSLKKWKVEASSTSYILDASEGVQKILELRAGEGITYETHSTAIYNNSSSDKFYTTAAADITDTTKLTDIGFKKGRIELLEVNSKKKIYFTINDSSTVGDIVSEINKQTGLNAELKNGMLTISGSSSAFITDMNSDFVSIFKLAGAGDGKTYTTINSTIHENTTSNETFQVQSTSELTNNAKLSEIAGYSHGSGKIAIHRDSGSYVTISLSGTNTIQDFFNKIKSYGIEGSIKDGKITLQADGDIYLEAVSGGSNILSVLNIGDIQKVKETVTSNNESNKLTYNKVIQSDWRNYNFDTTFGVIAGNPNDTITLGFEFNLNFGLDISTVETAKSALADLDRMLEQISLAQTSLGAAENRFESVLEDISIQYENLLSSRSTIQDTDIAEVSSEYIKKQILQQAAATLLATANQTPEIALQLINGTYR